MLDVRRRLEWAESHIDGAVHIPLHELLQRADEVPAGELWVHCAAGYRASIATSILLAARSPGHRRRRRLHQRGGGRSAHHCTLATRGAAGELPVRPVRPQVRLDRPRRGQRRVDEGAVLLDVREPSEWRAGHAPKARHIPLNDLDRRRKELPAGREIITVCRSGNRSARAAGILAADGHTVLQPVRWDAGLVGRRPPGRRQGRTARVHHLMDTIAAAVSCALSEPTLEAVPVMLIVAIPVGLLIGLSLGALGGGGSILTVPALVYLLGMDTRAATTGSLIIVGVTAVFGMLAHRRDGHVRVLQGMVFGALGAAGAVAGTRLSLAVPPDVLLAGFAVLMLAVAALMLTRRRVPAAAGGTGSRRTGAVGRADHHLHPRFVCACPRAAKVLVAAVAVGLMTGFFGVGGGFLVVPALVLALDFPMPVAVGTSLLVIAINSATSLVARAGTGIDIDWADHRGVHRGRRDRQPAGRQDRHPGPPGNAADRLRRADHRRRAVHRGPQHPRPDRVNGRPPTAAPGRHHRARQETVSAPIRTA